MSSRRIYYSYKFLELDRLVILFLFLNFIDSHQLYIINRCVIHCVKKSGLEINKEVEERLKNSGPATPQQLFNALPNNTKVSQKSL